MELKYFFCSRSYMADSNYYGHQQMSQRHSGDLSVLELSNDPAGAAP
jgi:hypothetical protein